MQDFSGGTAAFVGNLCQGVFNVRACSLALFADDQGPAAIGDDGQEVGFQRAVWIDLGNVAIESDECFLDRVFGIGVIAGDSSCTTKGKSLIMKDQLAKGLLAKAVLCSLRLFFCIALVVLLVC